jgi:hypothetical protein
MEEDMADTNPITEPFMEYITHVKLPDGNAEWRVYIENMWAISFGMGSEYAFKTIQEALDKAEEAK